MHKWKGYELLKEIYNLKQIYSNNGENFKELHVVIMQLKSWLRAIPTRVSKWHIQAYLGYVSVFILRNGK